MGSERGRGSATRTRILGAAQRLRRSGRQPTLADVAEAAGVSRATLHRVVGSRADLLSAIDASPDPDARERILAAALELVGRDGLPALSMDTLARRAGMSRANLYRLFPGKEALFTELVRVYSPLEPVLEVLRQRADRPPDEVMPEIARRAAAHLAGRQGLVLSLLMEISDPSPEGMGGRELAVHQGFAAGGKYLFGQMAAGRLRPMHPGLAMQMFVGPVLVHLLTRRLFEGVGVPMPPLEEAVTQLAEGWLRAMKLEE